ncbi:hypothetical protein ACWT_5802 [Actinoplanes sp. SE50]|uniref:hypothetical protein n=1 Tax=unclassified Actinoplanes TaxID=2626549 RepID=UPI00023EBC05|nr:MULTISPECIES: hypothetical protein [unclassified Actinoplanes]AEV86820.1 hypothetical protein ACPL_5933 [Actinoplanes sp. SE50/110]ATO85217.1 hypothetical protein ACWT_5802 [Actinoplanes sp. SE50]SLM02627.1 hypothetical protein ACSP50_5909 [Actinoplanes sp. SE50/110]
MGVLSSFTQRLRARFAPATPTHTDRGAALLPGAGRAEPHDTTLADLLARSARTTERLTDLDPDNAGRSDRQIAMLRSLSHVYYTRAGYFLPGPGPATAFTPPVRRLLQAMTIAADRREQAALLAQTASTLAAADPHDPALTAVAQLRAHLPAPNAAPLAGTVRPQLRPAGQGFPPLHPRASFAAAGVALGRAATRPAMGRSR